MYKRLDAFAEPFLLLYLLLDDYTGSNTLSDASRSMLHRSLAIDDPSDSLNFDVDWQPL